LAITTPTKMSKAPTYLVVPYFHAGR